MMLQKYISGLHPVKLLIRKSAQKLQDQILERFSSNCHHLEVAMNVPRTVIGILVKGHYITIKHIELNSGSTNTGNL